jgi:hypothetical protein
VTLRGDQGRPKEGAYLVLGCNRDRGNVLRSVTFGKVEVVSNGRKVKGRRGRTDDGKEDQGDELATDVATLRQAVDGSDEELGGDTLSR